MACLDLLVRQPADEADVLLCAVVLVQRRRLAEQVQGEGGVTLLAAADGST